MKMISYVNNGNVVTFKKAKPAHNVKLYFPKDTTAVIGHTRFTTQGSEKNMFSFTYSEELAHALGIIHIPPKEVIQTPKLLKLFS